MKDKIYYEKSYKIPLYKGHKLTVIVTNKAKKARKKYKINIDKNFYGETHYWFANIGHIIVILNPYYSKKGITIDLVAHEALHVVDVVMDNIGFFEVKENNVPHNEPKAYLIGWVASKIAKTLDGAYAKIYGGN